MQEGCLVDIEERVIQVIEIGLNKPGSRTIIREGIAGTAVQVPFGRHGRTAVRLNFGYERIGNFCVQITHTEGDIEAFHRGGLKVDFEADNLGILDEVEDRVDELEAKLLNANEDVMGELLAVYNELMMLRRTLAPHREILSRINRADVPFITATNSHYFRDIYDHLLRMSDLVDSCRASRYREVVDRRLGPARR